MKQQLAAQEAELAEKDEALAALRTAAVAGFPVDPDASDGHASSSSLRDQVAELNERNAELESHVDGLNVKIIALSDKHGREAAELRAELAASREVRKDEQDCESQTEALRSAHATIESLAVELAAAYADRTADVECRERQADALRAAQATVETLEAELTVRGGGSRQAWEPSSPAQESQYLELSNEKAALAEDLRLCRERIEVLGDEHSRENAVLARARDVAESANAALATEAGELRSELDRVKAEYRSTKAELTAHIEVLGDQHSHGNAILARARDVAESANAALATEAGELRSELEHVKAEYRSTKAELTAQVEVLSNEKATILDDLHSSQEKMKVLQMDHVSELDAQRGKAESFTSALTAEFGELKTELERANANFESRETELTERIRLLSEEKATLESRETELTERIRLLSEENATLESRETELTEQIRLLSEEKATLSEDLRVCREKFKAVEEERSSELDIMTRARDEAESASAALTTEVAELKVKIERAIAVEEERSSELDIVTRARDEAESAAAALTTEVAELKVEIERAMAYLESVNPEWERDTAANAGTETSDVRSLASLLVDGVEQGEVWEPSAALRGIADKLRSVHEERDELKTRVKNLIAATEFLLSDGEGNVPANDRLKAPPSVDHAAKLEQLEDRISELKAELESRLGMEAKVQSAEAALAETEAARAAEAQRAAKVEEQLKCKDEQVKSLELAMAKMKPPTPPLTNAEAKRLFKRDLERKEAIIRDLRDKCAEMERRSIRDEAPKLSPLNPFRDEPSLKEELEQKQSVIVELQTKVERVMRVHAEDVKSIRSKCHREIEEERLQTKELREAARKECERLFQQIRTLQVELATAQASRDDSARAELPVDAA